MDKATKQHWEGVWRLDRRRDVSILDIGTRNIYRVLRRYLSRGMQYLEIGCAPGRLLKWAGTELGVTVAGLDYSPVGIDAARQLCADAGLDADLRCEDVRQTSFPEASFDVVASFGLIEHFEDPAPFIAKHVLLARPGGTALVLIPNYRGIYGRLQRYFDSENLAIHNINIMTSEALQAASPLCICDSVEVRRIGRVTPGLISFEKKWPRGVARSVAFCLNVIGTVQPFDIAGVSPMFLLKLTRKQ